MARDHQGRRGRAEDRRLPGEPQPAALRRAHADSIPGLEILANDVRCTHAATISQVDRELLFFLMARGFPRHEAQRMVVAGYFADALERVANEDVRERFAAALEQRVAPCQLAGRLMRVCVTGASGKTGRAVVADLLAHGHQVVGDRRRGQAGHLSELGTPMVVADLTDYGQAVEVLQDADAVVHLANIPAPGLYPPAVRSTQLGDEHQRVPRRARRRGRQGGVVLQRDDARPAVRHSRRATRRWTRSTSRSPRRPTRCPRSSARPWPGDLGVARDPVRRAAPVQHPPPDDYQRCPATGATRACASGTCGATSTARRRPACRLRASTRR